MKRSRPSLDENALPKCTDFTAALQRAQQTDEPLENMLVENADFEGVDFGPLGVEQVVFVNCRFSACKFRHARFTDVIFRSCDISGSDFSNSRLVRCEIKNSKALGTLLCACYLQDVWFDNVKAHYLNLAASRLFFAHFAFSSFVSADFTGCELKQLQLEECDFSGASFYRTPLKGVDFRGCNLASLGVQLESPELKGAVMDFTQLADLADALGITLR